MGLNRYIYHIFFVAECVATKIAAELFAMIKVEDDIIE